MDRHQYALRHRYALIAFSLQCEVAEGLVVDRTVRTVSSGCFFLEWVFLPRVAVSSKSGCFSQEWVFLPRVGVSSLASCTLLHDTVSCTVLHSFYLILCCCVFQVFVGS